MKQYIEMSGTDACCLNDVCGATWTRRFLTDNFGSSYVNGKYKKMIDLNRVERVVATNSRFMEDAQRFKNKRDKEKEFHVSVKAENTILKEKRLASQTYRDLKDYIFDLHTDVVPSELNEELERLRDVYFQIRDKYEVISERRRSTQRVYHIARDAYEQYKSTGGGKGEKVVYQKACPQTDCNGFLSQKSVCGICNIHVCSKCRVVKGMTKDEIATHECKEEDIESVKAILKETKPCPRCGTRIHKIDGCDQMWCPYCQDKYGEGTAFSWKTGRIERGRIHNPHFIEHMRNRKGDLREVGDVHCGGLPPIWAFDRKLTRAPPHGTYNGDIPYDFRVRAMNIVRRVTEINQYVVDPLRATLRRQNVHRMDQIWHILGIDDDKTFRRNIVRTEKKREKDQEILDIFEVVGIVLTEKINHLYNEPTDLNVTLFLSFVEEFVKEENLCLADISYVYKQSVNIVNVDQAQHYYGSNMKVRLTTKKALEHYKKTGKILQKKTKTKAKAP
jgi:hypothetical protein